ncbi:polyphosphate polymerase domain-containing protein [Egicoccus halophilus]|uniref:VTC domain-containing protein n=1 Tax=Egicoccus halophilus TaxID=1670830 RepID=A0A8J3AA68_9ACTN|nr:polyphosphate polymerase domain-containing protein [Egicoccus halophilus]GGI05925.1 VTC domain-containing protein [Egicoccus halophilus]
MIDALLAALPGVRLDELPAEAGLQRRYDAKYLVPLARLPDLVGVLAADVHALEVEGRRSTAYSSVYFDTAELLTFTDHLKDRRRRFKVRTRCYGEAEPLLEVKYKGLRGQTVKERFRHTGRAADQLDTTGIAQVRQALAGHYPDEVPSDLNPVLMTRYRRSTLVGLDAGERVTIDRNLVVVDLGEPAPGHRPAGTPQRRPSAAGLGGSHAIVEVKSSRFAGPSHVALRSLGLRPDRLSKYCLGVTVTRPTVRGNPWLPVLRKLVERDDAA